ncbi:MAG: hypothetical protein ACI92B_001624, partial [Marinobacter maritimus]
GATSQATKNSAGKNKARSFMGAFLLIYLHLLP